MLEAAELFPNQSGSGTPLRYDPEVHLVAATIDNGVFHSAWMSAEYASALVERGSGAELARAEAVLRALLDCQDMDERSPHYGNFRWEREDLAVEDLNAVEFVLIRLIPMLLRRSDRLPDDLVERLKERVGIGLDAIGRIDVSPVYSNIVAQDVANSILGGQLLRREETLRRGLAKLRRWLAVVDQSGIPHEYNSPAYSFVLIEALSKVVALSHHEEACLLARLLITRVGLSVALRLHPGTGRLAPPHCRAYYPSLVCQAPPEAIAFSRLIAEGKLPGWLATVVKNRPAPMTVIETSDAAAGVDISSALDAAYSLGVASQELATQSNRFISNQSNVFAIHYKRSEDARPGVVFSRYLINDKWLGDYRTTPSRTNDHIFRDQGSFRGVLRGARAIGLYASRELDAWSRCFSAKSVLIWHQAADVDEIWVNGARVRELPAAIPERALIVVACGDVYIAVRPLERSDLGVDAPVRMVEHRGSLVLEMYNYLGPAKTFWELGDPGAFFQGHVRNGFWVEVAARHRYSNGQALHQALANGELHAEVDEPRTDDGHSQRAWRVSYSDGQQDLGIEVDLMRWRTLRRWADGADLDSPMLESPVARQCRSGHITLGAASLQCGQTAAWLLALPGAGLWAAAYHGPDPAPFALDLPVGSVKIERLEAGLVIWDNGQVAIDALGLGSEPQVLGAQGVDIRRWAGSGAGTTG